ncbi:MAG: YvcK family protein [SAR202 cluster bacterium]|nr:YvcK family protein [SAR202 cluster bacterium]
MAKKKIVVVGGGTGNYTTLKGLRTQDCSLTAVVAMTDSGGSSGRLREEMGQLPPGDVRRCLMALASEDARGTLMRQLFDYRFSSGDGLNGHSFGNLVLTVLTEVTGNTVTAIDAAAQLLGVQGKVLPVTLTRSTLMARLEDGANLAGEAVIGQRQEKPDVGIDHIWLEPKAYVYRPVLEAIAEADAIVLGPGDIYTSVLPNLLVEDVADAINSSKAIKIHVCNLMTKPGESGGFRASNFLKLLQAYLGTRECLDYLIFNSSPMPERVVRRYLSEGQWPVELDSDECSQLVKEVVLWPVLASGVYIRHDSRSLGEAIMEVVNRRSPAGALQNFPISARPQG